MIDLKNKLEKLEITRSECEMIAQLATDGKKRELYSQLALHFCDLVAETRKLIAAKNAACAHLSGALEPRAQYRLGCWRLDLETRYSSATQG